MLCLSLCCSLLLAPPAGEGPAEDAPPADPPASEADFGELEALPEDETREPGSSASGGYGALAPVPNYGEEGGEKGGEDDGDKGDEQGSEVDGRINEDLAEQPEPPRRKQVGFEEPKDFGPFFEPEPVSEVEFPGDSRRPDRKQPFASVGGGVFCFVEDSSCGSALLIDADVGVGLNVITSSRGFNVPYTQLRVRGGFTVRPIQLAKRRWHAWGVGLVGSWSLASGSVVIGARNTTDTIGNVRETSAIQSGRFGVINQLWLSQRRNALHLDFTLGGVNSSVLDADGRFWGTHAEIALGVGGWAGFYLAGDFLDRDARLFAGIRGHGMATVPLIGLILLGLVAGGVAL